MPHSDGRSTSSDVILLENVLDVPFYSRSGNAERVRDIIASLVCRHQRENLIFPVGNAVVAEASARSIQPVLLKQESETVIGLIAKHRNDEAGVVSLLCEGPTSAGFSIGIR
ncbi:MAG TPA: hypothetical protein VH188_01210 [Chthoniobacterales bacterium]|nr:hypothetical protein [Chthoniobacterales bacterium]